MEGVTDEALEGEAFLPWDSYDNSSLDEIFLKMSEYYADYTEPEPTNEIIYQMVSEPLTSSKTRDVLASIFYIYLIMAISPLGIIGNLINLLVFYRQGFLSDSCVPVFTGLAISDLGVCAYYLAQALCSCFSLFLPSMFKEIDSTFAQMTSLATVYLALERMVSVAFPFKVKDVFTPRVSLGIMITIYLVSFVLHLPSNVQTLFQSQLSELRADIEDIANFINNIVSRILCISLVFIFNIVIVIKVASSMRFRTRASQSSTTQKTQESLSKTTKTNSSSSSSSPSEATSNNEPQSRNVNTNVKTDVKMRTKKEIKLIRTMIAVSVTFLCCYFPNMIIAINDYYRSTGFRISNGILYITGLSSNKNDSSAFVIVERIGQFLEVVNSSCNIIIYYTMSTKYRTDLKQMLTCRKK